MSDWELYLTSVDQVPQSPDVITAVAKALVDAGVRDPASALGVQAAEIVESLAADAVAAKALVRRALRALEQSAKLQEVTAIAAASQVSVAVTQASTVPGASSASAMTNNLAVLLRPTVAVFDLLNQSSFSSVPTDGIPELTMFEDLTKATKAAKDAGRVPFIYVDLTQKELLPLWLIPESIGGKTSVSGDSVQIDGSQETNTVVQLTTALKSATAAPRFFRTLNQWLSCFTKYSIAAICCEQLTFSAILGHITTICRIVEDKKSSCTNSVHLALLYEEHRGKDWAKRAERKDPSLSIDTEAWFISEDLLRSVSTRLKSTMVAAGLNSNSESSGANAESSSAATIASKESALAKQSAALESQQRKLEADQRRIENNNSYWSKGGGKTNKNKNSTKGYHSSGNSTKAHGIGGASKRQATFSRSDDRSG